LLAEFYYGNNKKAEAKKTLTDMLAKSPDYFPDQQFFPCENGFRERDSRGKRSGCLTPF